MKASLVKMVERAKTTEIVTFVYAMLNILELIVSSVRKIFSFLLNAFYKYYQITVLNKLYCVLINNRAAQLVACGPHSARDAVLCGPQGLFARVISSWKGLLSIISGK